MTSQLQTAAHRQAYTLAMLMVEKKSPKYSLHLVHACNQPADTLWHNIVHSTVLSDLYAVGQFSCRTVQKKLVFNKGQICDKIAQCDKTNLVTYELFLLSLPISIICKLHGHEKLKKL